MRPAYDVVVVGGGPAGATAATDLAGQGKRVLMLDRAGRIKPCGGAIPPRLIADFAIPDEMLVARARAARIVSPSAREVMMPIQGGFVGMVDRADFDPWLRARAVAAGAEQRNGTYLGIRRDAADTFVRYRDKEGAEHEAATRIVIGADGALSAVARAEIAGAERMPFVFAYHEIVAAPRSASFDPACCDVVYRGELSPDFYGWVFPHGDTVSVGTGSAQKGFALRPAVGALRELSGLGDAKTIRCEGAPIPLRPLRRWDNGRDVVLAGDAAGVVAPASGEGIYYAMLGGRLAAEAASAALATGDARALRLARKRFMREHGKVFWALGIMQRYWYASDRRRERFVAICDDRDVQDITWDSYMNKRLSRARPLANLRIMVKNLAHLAGLVPA
jgi:geranylgeranyl reductase